MGGSLALYWIKVLNVLAIFHIIDICPKYAMLILTENTGNFANTEWRPAMKSQA